MIYGTLRIDGMSCASCSSSIESYVLQLGYRELDLFSISLLESKAKLRIEALEEQRTSSSTLSKAELEKDILSKIMDAIRTLGFTAIIDTMIQDCDTDHDQCHNQNDNRSSKIENEAHLSRPHDMLRTLRLTIIAAAATNPTAIGSGSLAKAFEAWMHTNGSAFLSSFPACSWSVQECSKPKARRAVKVHFDYEDSAACSFVPFYLALVGAFSPSDYQISIESEHERDAALIHALAKLWLYKSLFCLLLLVLQSALCLGLAHTGMVGWIEFVLTSILIASPVGYDFIVDGLRSLVLARRINMSLVISLAALAAYVISVLSWVWPDHALGNYYETCESLLLFTTLGKSLELTAKRWALQKLSSIEDDHATNDKADACSAHVQPCMANLLLDGLKGTSPADSMDSNSSSIHTHHLRAVAQVHSVPVALLRSEDRIRIYSGERVPIDGSIAEPELDECCTISSVSPCYYPIDQSILTGEARPLLLRIGDSVLAGSIYKGGISTPASPCSATPSHMDIVLACSDDTSSLSRMTRAAREASLHGRPPLQGLADCVSLYFLPTLVLLSLFAFLVSYFGSQAGLAPSLSRALSVLMISCPCSLGLAVPMATAVAMGASRRTLKTLVKAADAFERAASVSTILFDKTGTLTTGNMRVSKVLVVQEQEQEEKVKDTKNNDDALALAWQAVLEVESQYSFHPIARALAAHAQSQLQRENKKPSVATNLFIDTSEALPGLGLRAQLSTTFSSSFEALIGNSRLIQSHSLSASLDLRDARVEACVKDWETQGLTAIYCAIKGKLVLVFGLQDELQPGMAELMQRLRDQRYQIGCLTGDQQRNTFSVAKRIGIQEHCIWTGLTPLDKQQVIAGIQTGDIRLDSSEQRNGHAASSKDACLDWQSALLTAFSNSPVPYTPLYVKTKELATDLESGLQKHSQHDCQNENKRKRHSVLMIGDGLNDTLALGQSDLGIAFAGSQSIYCMSSQQMLLLASPSHMIQSSPIESLLDILNLAKRVKRRIRLNFFLSFLYNSLMIPLAMMGSVSPWMAPACMAASSMSVMLSSLALAWAAKRPRPRHEHEAKQKAFEPAEISVLLKVKPSTESEAHLPVRKIRFADGLPDANELAASDTMLSVSMPNQKARHVMAI